VAGIVELQETVAVPLLAKDVFESELQLSPEGTLVVSVNVLVNPLIRLTVTVDVADEPTLTLEGEEADRVKSGGAPKVNDAVDV
jgi:hypothetical protein